METADPSDAGTTPPTPPEGGASKPEAETKGEEKPNEMDALKAELAEMRQTAMKAQRDAAASQEYSQRIITELQMAAAGHQASRESAPVDPEALRERMQENPEAVLDAHFATRMRPLIEQNLELQAGTAQTLFETKYKDDEDYLEYKDEFARFIRGLPADTRAQPAAWDNALDFIKSKHLNEIANRRAQRLIEKRTALEKGAFVESGSAGGGKKTERVTLSDDQRSIAKGLGMSEEDYIHWMKQP